jgi:hypothetical protein
MHHDSYLERADSNVYGHSNGSMKRARVKQLQSALTSQISVIEILMSLEACKQNGNGSNMLVCFQIRLGS